MLRRIFIIIILIGTSTHSYAQENIDEDEMVGFACYYSGSSSKVVAKIERKVKRKGYKSIARLLDSENNAERYMAVIVLERLSSLNKYQLTETEKQLIVEIKGSEELVSVCSGCMYFAKLELRELFSGNIYMHPESWLNYHINEDSNR